MLQKKATNLVDHSCPIPDQTRPHAVQRLQVQLIVGLYRHATCRRALYSFRDRLGVSEVVLVALPKRPGISRRHLFDLVTERKQLPGHVVRGHAGFDPDQAWQHVHKSCGNAAAGHLFAQNDRALLIQANHVQRCSYQYRSQLRVQLRCLSCWTWRVLLVLFNPRPNSMGSFGAGARPVHPIRVIRHAAKFLVVIG